MSTPIGHAAGVFADLHAELLGVDIDFGALSIEAVPEPLRAPCVATWQQRVQTELRSAQVMTRFLGDVMAAGDPLEVYSAAADLVSDELRHVALCVSVVEALGAQAPLPDPPEEPLTPEFKALPPTDRALITAITMLAVSETVSVALIEDLRARCDHPVLSAVLEATISDEDHHRAFGWTYVEASLSRYPDADRPTWAGVAQASFDDLARHAAQTLSKLAPEERDLDAWPEPELARLGLLSPAREALIVARTLHHELEPRLASLGLA